MNSLVWGEVQSGKTSWICNLLLQLSNSIRSTHRITLFLAGSTDSLINQAKNRVINSFEKDNWLIARKEEGGFIEFTKKHQTTIISYAINEHIPSKENIAFYKWHKKEPLIHFIFILLKDVYWLLEFKNTILQSQNRFKLTLIDDECDFFSLSNETLEDKKINTSIHSLFNEKKVFISLDKYSISATPFAKDKINVSLDRIIVMKHKKEHWNHYKFLKEDMITNFKIVNSPLSLKKIEKCAKDFIKTYKSTPYVQFLINPGRKVKKTTNDDKLTIDSIYDHLSSLNDITTNCNLVKITGKESLKQEELFHITKPTIIVGGIKVSRGLTFKFLQKMLLYTSSSNSINSINLSDILQKARWCGYEDNKNIKKYKDLQIHISKVDFAKYVIASAIESRLRFLVINNGECMKNMDYVLSNDNLLDEWLIKKEFSVSKLLKSESDTPTKHDKYKIFYKSILLEPPNYVRKLIKNKNSTTFLSKSLVGINLGGFVEGVNVICIVCNAYGFHGEIEKLELNSFNSCEQHLIAKLPLFSYSWKNQSFSSKEQMYLELHPKAT